MPQKKKILTKTKRKVYNGVVNTKHCGRVQAFEYNGEIYIKCSECREWIKLNKREEKA